MNAKAIGARLRSLRELKGLSRRALAEKADVHYRTICNLEHGRVDNPGIATLEQVCKALGVEAHKLIEVAG
jgi:XRE family aerobic/anaerobic benzoate catabolism transcriptional regulator